MDNIPRALKAFVIAGGGALVAGTVLLIILLVMRASERKTPVSSAPIEIAVPAGGRIEQVTAGDGRLVLLGVDGTGRQFVVVVDPKSGARLGLIRLQPEP